VTAPLFDLRLFLVSPLFEGACFVLGLLVGSFANVCIHRLPLGRSIVRPPSRCPACGSLIASYDNVPVLGWLWLRGRCRTCRAPISIRYPAVELLNGLLYLGLALLFGPSPSTLIKMALSTTLLVLALIDLEHQILPDAITLPGLVLGLVVGALAAGGPDATLGVLGGLAAAAFVGMLTNWDRRESSPGSLVSDAKVPAMILAFLLWQRALPGLPLEPALAAGLGYLAMAGIARAAERYYGQEALGQGDWKMVAMLGAFLGLQGVLLAVFLGALGGALSGLLLVALRRGTGRTRIPLGTFLAAGALAVIFTGEPLLNWYRSLYRG
jgi:leader peptidase (prepilin peptidase)/N-methyltransferase